MSLLACSRWLSVLASRTRFSHGRKERGQVFGLPFGVIRGHARGHVGMRPDGDSRAAIYRIAQRVVEMPVGVERRADGQLRDRAQRFELKVEPAVV